MASCADTYDLGDNIGFLLRVCHQKSIAVFNMYAPHGLSAPRFAALAALAKSDGPMPQNRLGRMIAADAATIKGIVDRLRACGAVDTAANPADRRQRLVSLTDSGRQMYEEGVSASEQSADAMTEDLTPAEAGMLCELLKRAGGHRN